MTIGFQVARNDVDFRAGQLALDVRAKLADIGNFKFMLDAMPDPTLEALGYAPAEITLLRSAVADLDKLREIYLGVATQASLYDFRTFSKFLTGVM